ncbi:MAG: PAS domain-containing protein [bacterium]|nr:PAS domain-containing protein [bacterium]
MPDSSHNGPPPALCLTPAFGELLAGFDLDALARQPDTIIGLDADLRLAFLNPAWFAFAAANGGGPAIVRDWGLGRCVLDACPPVIRDFYARALTAALQQDKHWDHDYECSSPDVRRHMRLTAYPLRDRGGLLVVHALIVATPRDTGQSAGTTITPADYADGNGIVHQCSHCRKIRRTSGPRHWDWVPELVANPSANTSHDLCDVCLDFYYPTPGDLPPSA